MLAEKYPPEPRRILIERVTELERERVDQDEVIEKIFARLKRTEDRLDQILGSEPRESDEAILRPARDQLEGRMERR